MAVNIPDVSYGQLSAALTALAQTPGTQAPGGVGTVGGVGGVDGYGYDLGGYGMPLQGPMGYVGAPSNLPGVDPASGTPVYNGFGPAATTGLSPSEQQMFGQLAMEDPAAAQKFLLQMKLQKLMELASLVSNMSKTRHNTAMGIIQNTK